MLKFGVHRIRDLRPETLTSKGGRRKFVAITLYPEVVEERSLELILCRFADANGIYKRTYRERFQEFDHQIVHWIRELGIDKRVYCAHDLAASNGATSADLYRILPGKLTFVASDYLPEVAVIGRDRLSLVYDPATGDWLQIIFPPFVFNLKRRESAALYPLNRLICRWLERARCPALWQQRDRARIISLLHPACRDLSGFHYRRCDVLKPMHGPYDVVRAMNLLNHSYFDREGLRTVIRNIYDSLSSPGLFATGSNQDRGTLVNGAIYRKGPDGFERLCESGAGSPVDDLIVAMQPRGADRLATV
jgi:hypothetical protein